MTIKKKLECLSLANVLQGTTTAQHNHTQQNGLICHTQHNSFVPCYAESRYAQCRYVRCRCAFFTQAQSLQVSLGFRHWQGFY